MRVVIKVILLLVALLMLRSCANTLTTIITKAAQDCQRSTEVSDAR